MVSVILSILFDVLLATIVNKLAWRSWFLLFVNVNVILNFWQKKNFS